MLPEGRENILDLDFRQWLAARRVRFYENAEDAFAGALAERAARLPFVKRARVELQTSLGGRKGAGGVDVAGALRETDDDIVGWQLRGYAAEHGSKGLNTGLFYRRVVGGALAGVNVFADYEDGDDGDFWRWSVGGDVKNRFGELSANRYFAITDAQVVGGKNTYTREGYDVDFALRIPRLEWAKARVGYYEFKGEFGDEDENGFRAGLDLSPGEGLVLGVEYDDDDGKFGGNISYTHNFGETSRGAQRAGDFNPRAHFYDSVAREYSQRISRASGGGNAVIVNAAIDVGVFGDGVSAMVITAAGSFAFPATGAVTATTHATGNDGDVTMRQGWELVVGNNAEIVFSRGASAASATIAVTRGRGTFTRNNANITLMQMGGAVITLLGTRFDFNAGSNTAVITLREGELGIPSGGNVSVVAAQGAMVRIGGAVVGCGAAAAGDGASANCGFGMTAAGADVVTAITAPAAGDVIVGRFVLAQRAGDINARVSGEGFFLMTSQMSIVNVLISQSAAAVPDADVKRATLHLTDAAGLLSPTVSAAVFAARVNSPDAGFGMAVAGADVMTAVTAPAAGDVVVGRYVLAQRAGDINASVSGEGFFAMTSDTTLNVLISQAAAAVADVNVKRVTLHLTDTANLLLPPVSAAVFTMRVNPQPINLMFVGDINNAPLTMAGDIIVGTLEVTNGFGAANINFAAASGAGFRLDNIDNAANRRALVLLAPNTAVRALSVTLTGDDDNAPQTNAKMLSVTVNVVDRVGLRGGGRYSVYAVNAESAPVVVFEPFGGTPPFNMQVASAPTNVPAGFSRQNNISATITRTTDNAVGGMEHEFIQEISETRTNGDSATATATITVIAPISASYELSTTLTIEINMGSEPNVTATVGVGELSIGAMQTVATISAGGGVGSYVFSDNHNDVSFIEGSVMVANFANHATVTVDIVIDDRENGNAVMLTPPLTISVSLTASPPIMPVTAAPLPIISLTIGVNYGATPDTPAFTIMASGGVPPLKCAVNSLNIPSYIAQPVQAWAVFGYRPESCVFYFRNGAVHANAPTSGITEEGGDGFIVEDSSTPPLRYLVPPISVQFVASE